MISTYKNKIPFFSVIISTYNRVKLLPRALDSLINQTESDWEAIIIDDGSTDGTFNLVRSYIEKYPKIKYIYHSHRGTAFSKNAGVLASSGLYVTFLDSDDEYKPEHLNYRRTLFIENPEVDFIHGEAEIIGNPYVPDKFNAKELIHLDHCAIGGTFFFRREPLISLDGFKDMEYSDDSDLYERARKSGLEIGKTDLKTYIYHRDTEDSICNRIISKSNLK